MEEPCSIPIAASDFDHKNPEHFRLVYHHPSIHSVIRMRHWLLENIGKAPSEKTLHQYRKMHHIQLVSRSDVLGDEQRKAQAALDEDRNILLREIDEYLKTRQVPDGYEWLRQLERDKSLVTMLVSSDWHSPWVHKMAAVLILRVLADLKPDMHVLAGDTSDWACLSKFGKDIRYVNTLGRELEPTRRLLRTMVEANAVTQTILIPGNHEEDRLRAYINSKCPELADVELLNVESLLGLSEIGVSYAPEGIEVVKNEMVIDHGDRHTNTIGGGSARSAQKEQMDLGGLSSITGHTHHGGVFYRTDRRGLHISIENFCVCDQQLMKRMGVTRQRRKMKVEDWHLGFSMVQYNPDNGDYYMTPYPIIPKEDRVFCVVEGVKYEVKDSDVGSLLG